MKSVNNQITAEAEYLLESYGPLMTIEELSEVLKRPISGLRYSLLSNSPFSEQLVKSRIRIGKRIYFQSTDVADMIQNSTYTPPEKSKKNTTPKQTTSKKIASKKTGPKNTESKIDG